MNNIIEIMPDNMPEWMQTAMAEGRLARACMEQCEWYKRELDQLASFNPDWDMLKASRDSLLEHMKLLGAAQAKIDALMLEYCPDEMTEEQMANWERHQVPATDEEMEATSEALKKKARRWWECPPWNGP